MTALLVHNSSQNSISKTHDTNSFVKERGCMNFEFQVLKAKSNEELINALKLRVENERRILMEILYALREVEDRKLHLEMGFPDLYSFAIKELGYSSGAAYRRISAMRLLKTVPEVAPKLESGELGLENASNAQSFFRKEDQRRKQQGEQKLSIEEKREVVAELFGKSSRQGQRVLMEHAPDVMIPTEKTRPLPEHKTLVQFVATAELMEKLEELKDLLAHQNFEGRMDVLVEKLADIALKRLKLASVRQATSTSTSTSASASASTSALTSAPMLYFLPPASRMKQIRKASDRSRYIPTQVRRRVLLRDKNGCTYKDLNSGRTCGSRHGLQYDHIVPFSLGGVHSAENLTLRCGAHNRYGAEKMG